MIAKYKMRFLTVYVYVFVIISAFTFFSYKMALAQDKKAVEKKPYEEGLKDAIQAQPDPSFWTFTIENDLFGSGRDEYYTSGFQLTYYDAGAGMPDYAHRLADLVPTFDLNETSSVYYAFGQTIFTPQDITKGTPDPRDRPYAGFLYGTAGLISAKDNHQDDLTLTLGVVGPLSGAEAVQKNVHDLIGADDPKGWDHQLENEPGLILSWRRMWPGFGVDELNGLHIKTQPHIGVTLGNIYSYANIGGSIQITPSLYQWQSQPLRVQPAVPGDGFFSVPENRFAWSGFLAVEGRTVARNIFLDGNSFEDSPSVDKKPVVADVSGGVSLTYGRVQLSYTLNWRSAEFDWQGEPSVFGAVSIGRRF